MMYCFGNIKYVIYLMYTFKYRLFKIQLPGPHICILFLKMSMFNTFGTLLNLVILMCYDQANLCG